jgi:hypothetical protein
MAYNSKGSSSVAAPNEPNYLKGNLKSVSHIQCAVATKISRSDDGELDTNSLLAALYYAEEEWPLFPCAPRSKFPLFSERNGGHGSKDATTDAKLITAWWTKAPKANIALATGHKFWVLDIDPRHGGDESLESLELKHGKLPDTLAAVTPTGGKHLYFALPPDFVVRNSAGKIGPGIDVRGDGGYVLAAPSIHPDGGEYQWDGMDGFRSPILPAPEWLFKLIKGEPQSDKRKAEVIPMRIPHGQQHDWLVSVAGSMRNRGAVEDEIYAALITMNNSRCEVPGPDKNIRKIAHSMMQYSPGSAPESGYALPANPDEKPAGNPNWKEQIEGLDGKIKVNLSSIMHALEHAPEFAEGIAFDECALAARAMRPLPGGVQPGLLNDHYEGEIVAYFESEYGFSKIPTSLMHEAIATVARRRSFHPVKDYLTGLKWDRIERISYWLSEVFGCSEDDPYVQMVGRKWLISAVKRIMEPGSKADYALILEGRQGVGKSKVAAALGGQWFTDELGRLDTKDAAIQLSGKWIIELAELDGFSRAEVSTVKAFISRKTDRYRPPYGRHAMDVPRQCVFIGSTNDSEYLKDATGGRRFWPVKTSDEPANMKWIEAARDQLWAEALHAHEKGEESWISDPEILARASAEQAKRYDSDPWQESIETYCSSLEHVSTSEILTNCIKKSMEHWTQQDKSRVARCLTIAGWKVKVGKDKDRKSTRLYVRAGE